jgi:hypothetical protein
MRIRTVVLTAIASALSLAAPAAAVSEWRHAQTVSLVRGIPDPKVAIDGQGDASLVYSSASDPFSDETITRLAVRAPGTQFADLGPEAGGEDAEIATNPAGATAIAAVRGGRLFVTLYPAPGPQGSQGLAAPAGTVVPVPAAGTSVDDPILGVDEAGRVTVVWTAPASLGAGEALSRVYAVEIDPAGVAGDVQELGGPGACDPLLDVNLRGDAAVVTNCPSGENAFFQKPAGGSFGAPDTPWPYDTPITGIALDGVGNAYLVQTRRTNLGQGTSDYEVVFIVRSPDGVSTFSRLGTLVGGEDRDFAYDVEENGRVIAAWASEGAVRYVVRQPGVGFGPAQSVPSGPAYGISVVASHYGPSLVSWREHLTETSNPTERLRAVALDIDGNGRVASLGVKGDFGAARDTPASSAINEAGQAVVAWEQRCSSRGAFAVMAVALDEASTTREPPCQDTRPPKAISVRKRALLRKRMVKARVACDEACGVTATVRILRAGSRRPLAGGKTRGAERRLRARRGAWIGVRLRRKDAIRVHRALRSRRRVTVRLALSVRDVYGNGRTWRLRVPLRR